MYVVMFHHCDTSMKSGWYFKYIKIGCIYHSALIFVCYFFFDIANDAYFFLSICDVLSLN